MGSAMPPYYGGYLAFGYPPVMPAVWPGAAPFMMDGTAVATAPGRYRGKIKSFNVEKGFGFIDCADTRAQFGRDVFVHKAHIGDFAVGTEVTFTVETNKREMPQAKDLQVAGPGPAGGASA